MAIKKNASYWNSHHIHPDNVPLLRFLLKLERGVLSLSDEVGHVAVTRVHRVTVKPTAAGLLQELGDRPRLGGGLHDHENLLRSFRTGLFLRNLLGGVRR